MIHIAIDGPAGSGKSTVAKILAQKLNISYIDTGAMYRAVTLKLKDFDPKDFKKILDETSIDFIGQDIFLDGKNVSSEIRTEEISKLTSDFSKIDFIREKLVDLQRKIAEKKSCVMEGRDITTVVLPHAKYKFFLSADPEVRARRRHDQLLEKNMPADYNKILEDLKKRDENDMNRENSPLKIGDDVLFIDSSKLNGEETADLIISKIGEANV